ncbi:hypothetical protein [Ruegeria sp. HKCCD7255]|uniref:hypothetical protein n=1 Tax=Ruegeria sp. HKCCD7255 TaxID=2683004 RepID=UPI001487745E|nr:hypothetical protein [Ruegeria sp. HKCCD7255]
MYINMTLRELWAFFGDGFHTAAHESFWDWPLWLSVPVGIGCPLIVLILCAIHVSETRRIPQSFWESAGFLVAAILCAIATYEIYFVQRLIGYSGYSGYGVLVQIVFPMMTSMFGFAAIHGFVVLARRRRRQD